MTAERFNALLDARLAAVREVLVAKAGEYADDADRLHNFKTCADEFGGTPEEALWGFMKKHLISIRDMVKGIRTRTPAMVNEKFTDTINYLILLEAVFTDGGLERR